MDQPLVDVVGLVVELLHERVDAELFHAFGAAQRAGWVVLGQLEGAREGLDRGVQGEDVGRVGEEDGEARVGEARGGDGRCRGGGGVTGSMVMLPSCGAGDQPGQLE